MFKHAVNDKLDHFVYMSKRFLARVTPGGGTASLRAQGSMRAIDPHRVRPRLGSYRFSLMQLRER